MSSENGDDYRWDQMSVMERCEVLRAEVCRFSDLARRVDGAERWQRGDHSLFDGLIGDLARRVAEIEKERIGLDQFTQYLDERLIKVERACLNTGRFDTSESHPAEVMITKTELARLRRVEEAASKCAWEHEKIPDGVAPSWLRFLRSALDSEPER